LNCRVFERHPSDLPSQCQPLAARGDDEVVWQATVHDISAGGIGLLLQRRFEPRTSLAIELPDAGDSTYTVFVRVVHALGQPHGRWLLGCSFVTPLSEERLSALLLASGKQPRTKSPPPAETTKLPEVAVPEVTKPEVTKPEVTKPEVAKPEVAKPEVGRPEIAKPEVGRPEVAKQQVAKQQVAKPEVAKPEVAKQQVAKQQVAKPEVAKPEVADKRKQ
jgi:hypothetical protein